MLNYYHKIKSYWNTLPRNFITWGLPSLAIICLLFVATSVINRIYLKPAESSLPYPPHTLPYQKRLAASGYVDAISEQLAIASADNGIITQIHVEVGDWVKKGEPLFSLDQAQQALQVKMDESQVQIQENLWNKANIQLNQAKEQFAFYEELTDRRAVSADDYSTRKFQLLLASNALNTAESQLVASKAKLAYSQYLLDRLVVRAPIDGQILNIDVHLGELSQHIDGSPSIILGDTSSLQVIAQLDESQIALFNPQNAAIGLLTHQEENPIDLKLIKIRPRVVAKQNLTGSYHEKVDTRILEVVYKIEKSNLKLYPGQEIDVYINRD